MKANRNSISEKRRNDREIDDSIDYYRIRSILKHWKLDDIIQRYISSIFLKGPVIPADPYKDIICRLRRIEYYRELIAMTSMHKSYPLPVLESFEQLFALTALGETGCVGTRHCSKLVTSISLSRVKSIAVSIKSSLGNLPEVAKSTGIESTFIDVIDLRYCMSRKVAFPNVNSIEILVETHSRGKSLDECLNQFIRRISEEAYNADVSNLILSANIHVRGTDKSNKEEIVDMKAIKTRRQQVISLMKSAVMSNGSIKLVFYMLLKRALPAIQESTIRGQLDVPDVTTGFIRVTRHYHFTYCDESTNSNRCFYKHPVQAFFHGIFLSVENAKFYRSMIINHYIRSKNMQNSVTASGTVSIPVLKSATTAGTTADQTFTFIRVDDNKYKNTVNYNKITEFRAMEHAIYEYLSSLATMSMEELNSGDILQSFSLMTMFYSMLTPDITTRDYTVLQLSTILTNNCGYLSFARDSLHTARGCVMLLKEKFVGFQVLIAQLHAHHTHESPRGKKAASIEDSNLMLMSTEARTEWTQVVDQYSSIGFHLLEVKSIIFSILQTIQYSEVCDISTYLHNLVSKLFLRNNISQPITSHDVKFESNSISNVLYKLSMLQIYLQNLEIIILAIERSLASDLIVNLIEIESNTREIEKKFRSREMIREYDDSDDGYEDHDGDESNNNSNNKSSARSKELGSNASNAKINAYLVRPNSFVELISYIEALRSNAPTWKSIELNPLLQSVLRKFMKFDPTQVSTANSAQTNYSMDFIVSSKSFFNDYIKFCVNHNSFFGGKSLLRNVLQEYSDYSVPKSVVINASLMRHLVETHFERAIFESLYQITMSNRIFTAPIHGNEQTAFSDLIGSTPCFSPFSVLCLHLKRFPLLLQINQGIQNIEYIALEQTQSTLGTSTNPVKAISETSKIISNEHLLKRIVFSSVLNNHITCFANSLFGASRIRIPLEPDNPTSTLCGGLFGLDRVLCGIANPRRVFAKVWSLPPLFNSTLRGITGNFQISICSGISAESSVILSEFWRYPKDLFDNDIEPTVAGLSKLNPKQNVDNSLVACCCHGPIEIEVPIVINYEHINLESEVRHTFADLVFQSLVFMTESPNWRPYRMVLPIEQKNKRLAKMALGVQNLIHDETTLSKMKEHIAKSGFATVDALVCVMDESFETDGGTFADGSQPQEAQPAIDQFNRAVSGKIGNAPNKGTSNVQGSDVYRKVYDILTACTNTTKVSDQSTDRSKSSTVNSMQSTGSTNASAMYNEGDMASILEELKNENANENEEIDDLTRISHDSKVTAQIQQLLKTTKKSYAPCKIRYTLIGKMPQKLGNNRNGNEKDKVTKENDSNGDFNISKNEMLNNSSYIVTVVNDENISRLISSTLYFSFQSAKHIFSAAKSSIASCVLFQIKSKQNAIIENNYQYYQSQYATASSSGNNSYSNYNNALPILIPSMLKSQDLSGHIHSLFANVHLSIVVSLLSQNYSLSNALYSTHFTWTHSISHVVHSICACQTLIESKDLHSKINFSALGNTLTKNVILNLRLLMLSPKFCHWSGVLYYMATLLQRLEKTLGVAALLPTQFNFGASGVEGSSIVPPAPSTSNPNPSNIPSTSTSFDAAVQGSVIDSDSNAVLSQILNELYFLCLLLYFSSTQDLLDGFPEINDMLSLRCTNTSLYTNNIVIPETDQSHEGDNKANNNSMNTTNNNNSITNNNVSKDTENQFDKFSKNSTLNLFFDCSKAIEYILQDCDWIEESQRVTILSRFMKKSQISFNRILDKFCHLRVNSLFQRIEIEKVTEVATQLENIDAEADSMDQGARNDEDFMQSLKGKLEIMTRLGQITLRRNANVTASDMSSSNNEIDNDIDFEDLDDSEQSSMVSMKSAKDTNNLNNNNNDSDNDDHNNNDDDDDDSDDNNKNNNTEALPKASKVNKLRNATNALLLLKKLKGNKQINSTQSLQTMSSITDSNQSLANYFENSSNNNNNIKLTSNASQNNFENGKFSFNENNKNGKQIKNSNQFIRQVLFEEDDDDDTGVGGDGGGGGDDNVSTSDSLFGNKGFSFSGFPIIGQSLKDSAEQHKSMLSLLREYNGVSVPTSVTAQLSNSIEESTQSHLQNFKDFKMFSMNNSNNNSNDNNYYGSRDYPSRDKNLPVPPEGPQSSNSLTSQRNETFRKNAMNENIIEQLQQFQQFQVSDYLNSHNNDDNNSNNSNNSGFDRNKVKNVLSEFDDNFSENNNSQNSKNSNFDKFSFK